MVLELSVKDARTVVVFDCCDGDALGGDDFSRVIELEFSGKNG